MYRHTYECMENMLRDGKNCFSTSTPIYLAAYRNHPPHSALARTRRFRDLAALHTIVYVTHIYIYILYIVLPPVYQYIYI